LKNNQLDKIFFFLAAVFAFLLKVFYSMATLEQLRFILLPTNFLVEIFIGQKSVFSIEKGYFYQIYSITIDKFCAGINFWLIAFLAVFFGVSKYYDTFLKKTIFFLLLILLSFGLTIFTNASRIIIAIKLQKLPFLWSKTPIFHEAQGAFMYLFVLILFYVSIERWHNQSKIY
jgi:exosortase K